MNNDRIASAPGARARGIGRPEDVCLRILFLVSSLLLAVLAGCDAGALSPEGGDLWPSGARLVLNAETLELAEGDTYQLETTVISGSGTVIGRVGTGQSGPPRGMPAVVYTSSDPSTAIVDESGLVSAVGEGDAVISVSSGSLTAYSRAKVNGNGYGKGGKPKDEQDSEAEPTVVSIAITPSEVTLRSLGDTVRLTTSVLDEEGAEVTTSRVTWTSQNPEVASVDGSGKVVAQLGGIALIVATTGGGLADTATVEVKQSVASVSVEPASETLVVGDSLPLAATALDANGNEVDAASFTWRSSNEDVLGVDADGVAKALSAGAARVTVAVSGSDAAASASLTVEALAQRSGPSTWIEPGDDIQAKVNAHPAGTVFTVKAGVHRLQRIVPRDGQQFVGEPGAILNGAKLLTDFQREGSYWVASGQERVSNPHGSCIAERPRCNHPEDLFIDDRPLIHVSSLSEVKSGSFHFDYSAGKVYFADDPRGRKVELGATPAAFAGSASNVVVRGLTIEKYANRAQYGAIHADNARGWIIEDNVVRYNHGVGIRIGDEAVVRGNSVIRNGQLGIGGLGDDVLVENNEIAYNNNLGYSWGWEGGGTKFVRTHRLVVRGNHAHHNFGPGIWSDIDNIHTLYEGNRVEDNDAIGIFHEISYDAVIRDNTVRNNGWSNTKGWFWGAGILVVSSPNVEITGNVVEGNAGAIGAIQDSRSSGSGAYGQRLVRGLHVHGNTVKWTVGPLGVGGPDPDMYTGSNRFERNEYTADINRNHWHWENKPKSYTEWKAFGME